MKDKPANGLHYFEMGTWPVFVGFTMSKAAFAAEMKRLNVNDPPEFVRSGSNACTHTFERDSDLTCIITLKGAKGKKLAQIAAMVAHEAVHVAQRLWEGIGEDRPGKEAEAYLVQHITQCCLLNIGKAWKRP